MFCCPSEGRRRTARTVGELSLHLEANGKTAFLSLGFEIPGIGSFLCFLDLTWGVPRFLAHSAEQG